MAKLLGILNDGIGGVISHAKIILTAQHNSAKVLKGTQSIIDTDSQGAYSFTVQPSHYTVALRLPEGADLILGSIVVNSDSKNGTLNDFLLTPNDVSIITPEILLQIQQCRTEAQHAAEQALTAERNAAKTLEGAVKKTGDTMIGDLAIKKNLPILKMINAAGDYEFRITAANGNYTQIATTTSDGNVRTTLRWNKPTNTWNFENSSVLINDVPVLKKGDYGLGADVTANTIIGDISKILSTGFYIVNQSTTGNVPFPACSLFVQRINATEQTGIAVSTFNSWPIKTGVYTNGAWVWQTHVTTTNIKDHALPIMGGCITGNLGIKKGRPVLYLNNTDNGQQVNIALGKNFAISFMEAEKEKFFLVYNPITGDTEFNAPVQLSKDRITDITPSSSSPGKSSLSDAVIKGDTWGVFNGADTPTLGKTSNLTIASWYGVGFAPLYGTGMSNNTVAIDTRKGLINTKGGVYENGVKLIKQGEAAPFSSRQNQDNSKVHYKKLAEILAFNASNEVKKVSFIISGANRRVDKHNSLDFITFGGDGDKVHLAHQILSDSDSSANRLKVGWYYNQSTSSYELWLRFNTFRGAFGITRVSGISAGITEYVTDSFTEKMTIEEKNISFVEPVLNLTTANLNNYLSSATILYHGGTQSKPALLSKGQKIVIDNPSKSLNIQVQVELLINNIWGIATEPNVWNNSGNWYSSGVWVNVSETSITITTSITGLASNVTPNAWGATTNLLEAPYRLRIIKMGE